MIKPKHPLFSPTSIILTVVFLAGLAGMIFLNGNKLFSPGRLSAKAAAGLESGGFASHAAFEKQCRNCHVPLAGDPQALCLECHKAVAQEIEMSNGIHSKIEAAFRCADCHPEHRGSQFDSRLAALQHFDHIWTGFSLVKHQLDYDVDLIDCSACHIPDQGYTYQADRCVGCHEMHDKTFQNQHILAYGKNCLDCHDGTDRAASFDHRNSGFPLTGKHASTDCALCHGLASPAGRAAPSGGRLTLAAFQNAPTECIACHAQPASHQGSLSPICQDCHSAHSWTSIAWAGNPFSHAEQAGFSLERHRRDYAGQPITCLGCHSGDFQGAELSSCIACHSGGQSAGFMQDHIARFGQGCLDCHDGIDRMSGFDHQAVFPLEGSHAALDCLACHQNKVFQGAPRRCAECHAEPAIHAGDFGLNCQDCHTALAWSPAALRSHSFPLDHGGHAVAGCQTCHTDTYTQYTCYGCHEHTLADMVEKHEEKGISFQQLKSCVKCHPSGKSEE